MERQQQLHPLLRYDPDALNGGIQLLKLEYFEAQTTVPPLSMLYLGVDFVVELVVFSGTVLMLRKIYPELSTGRILRGLLRMHWKEMAMLTITAWVCNLLFQTTYGGMDMTMKFDWLECRDEENVTWRGGFVWENC